MQKKPSGLGRGLDELLDDNTPSLRENKGKPLVVARGEAEEKKSNDTMAVPLMNGIYDTTPKTLYNTRPRTKSVKSNFKK